MRMKSPPPLPDETEASATDLDLSHLSGMVGYAIRRAQVALFRDLKARFRVLDISPAQFAVLLVVEANPGLAQARVAEALGIERARLVLMLDRLEHRNLLVRTRSKSDRRSHALHLTSAGARMLRTLLDLQAEHERDIEEAIGAKGKADLLSVLGPLQTQGFATK